MTVHSNQVTLFIVEDDDIDFMSIKRSFKDLKIANPLIRAHNGEEAISLLQANEMTGPFIVLLDLQMPKMSGLEFLSELRADPKLKDTVVFVLTTSSDESDIMASYQHNIAGYFVKDDVGTELLKVITLLDGYWKIVHLPMEREEHGRNQSTSS